MNYWLIAAGFVLGAMGLTTFARAFSQAITNRTSEYFWTSIVAGLWIYSAVILLVGGLGLGKFL